MRNRHIELEILFAIHRGYGYQGVTQVIVSVGDDASPHYGAIFTHDDGGCDYDLARVENIHEVADLPPRSRKRFLRLFVEAIKNADPDGETTLDASS